MSNMKLMIAIGVTGTQAASREINSFAATNVRAAKRVADAWGNGGNIMNDSMRGIAKAAAMVGGLSLAKNIIQDVAAFDKGMSSLRQTGQITKQALAAIRKDILDTARDVLQLPEAQLAAYDKMVAAGLDPTLVQKFMKPLSRASTGSFSELEDMAASAIDLIQKMNISPEGMPQALDTMITGSRLGRFEMNNMARFIPVVASEMQNFGINGQRGVAQMTAMLQISRRSTGTPEAAAINMQNFLGHIVPYAKDLGKHLGIKVWDYFDVKTGKLKKGKEIDDFFEMIIKKTGGSAAKLQLAGIRDVQALAFIKAMMANWEDSVVDGEKLKGYKTIRDESLRDGKGAADRSFDEVKDDAWANLKKAEIDRSVAFKSDNAAKGAVVGSGALSDATGWAIDNPGKATATAAGLVVTGYSILRMVRGFMAGKSGDLGGAGRSALAGGGVPLPVYVVNKHLSMLPGNGGWGFPGGAPRSPGGTAAATAATAAGIAGAAVPAIIAGVVTAGGFMVHDAFFDKTNDHSPEFSGFGGESGDGFSWGALFNLFQKDREPPKNEINMQVSIDRNDRVISSTDDPNTRTRITPLKRGNFADANNF